MNNYDELIYEFLKEQNKPLTIKQINDSPAFAQLSRQELSKILKGMQRGGDVYRKVIDGKAFYSTDPTNGEGLNPNQKFIKDVTNKMNLALNGGGDKQAQIGALLKAIGNIDSSDIKETDVNADRSILDFTFHDNIRIDTPEYSILIPDGFKVERNIDGRDFIAWIPSEEDPDDYNFGKVTLFAGKMLPADALRQMGSIRLRSEMLDSLASKLQTILGASSLFEEETAISVNTDDYAGHIFRGYADNAVHSNAYITLNDKIQMMRLQFLDVTKNEIKLCDRAAQNWIKTITLKTPVKCIASIDQQKFTNDELSTYYLDSLKSCVKENDDEIELYRNLRANNEMEKYRNSTNPSLIQLKKNLRKMTQQCAQEKADLYRKVIEYLGIQSKKNTNEYLLMQFYDYVNGLLDKEVPSINLDGGIIKEELPNKKELKDLALTPEIMAIKTERERREKLRRELEQKRNTYNSILKNINKNNAESLRNAANKLEKLGDFEDAASKVSEFKEKAAQIEIEERKRKHKVFDDTKTIISSENAKAEDLMKAKNKLKSIAGFEGVDSLLKECETKYGLQSKYEEAIKLAEMNTVDSLRNACKNLEFIKDYKDSNKLLEDYHRRIDEIEEQIRQEKLEQERIAAEKLAEEKRQQKKKRIRTISIILILAAAIIGGVYYGKVIYPRNQYQQGLREMEAENYSAAKEIFIKLGDYEDSADRLAVCDKEIAYAEANLLFENGEYEEAMNAFEAMGDFKESETMKKKSQAEMLLINGNELLDSGKYADASAILKQINDLDLSEYTETVDNDFYTIAKASYEKKDYSTAEDALAAIKNKDIIDKDFASKLSKAAEKQKAEKLIADSYNEIMNMKAVREKDIDRVEKLLSIIPDDYKSINSFKKPYYFYKPYIGTYIIDGYSLKKDFSLSNYKGEWVGSIDDISSGGRFTYPNLSVSYSDKYKGSWRISGSTITHVYTGNKTFTTVYRKQ